MIVRSGLEIRTKRRGSAALCAAAASLVLAVVGLSLSAFATPAVFASPGGEHAHDSNISTENVRTSETEAGNLIADAVRAASATDVSFVPAAAFKPGATAPRPASAEEIVGLVDPAADTISILNLRGDQIIAALERSVSFEPQPSSGFLQVSGLRFTYDVRKEGGKRVVSATVNGQPLDASKVYKVSTTKPLAHGQQGYFQIWEKGDIANDTTKSIDTAVKDYVKTKNGSVSPATDGRIVQSGK